MVIVVSAFLIQKPKRDVGFIHDINVAERYWGRKIKISLINDSHDTFRLQEYFERMYHITVVKNNSSSNYYIAFKDGKSPSDGYVRLPFKTKVFDLYKKK